MPTSNGDSGNVDFSPRAGRQACARLSLNESEFNPSQAKAYATGGGGAFERTNFSVGAFKFNAISKADRLTFVWSG